ncbi:MAG: FAD-linked oxidase C-terminal domain-containing protein [Pseudomonadota bacterium]
MAKRYSFIDLAATLQGQIHTDKFRRQMLATDASIFSKLPSAVVYPRTTADVQAVVRFAAEHGLAIHPRGAGSGLAGAAVGDGVVIDFSKFMNRLLRLDTAEGWFECQPGYRFGELEEALKGKGLFFPPDPSSGEYASFGGMCATNASGAHSVKYGNVADYLLDAEVVMGDGSVHMLDQVAGTALDRLPFNLGALAGLYRDNAAAIESAYPPIACNVAGYNLRGLVDGGRLRLHRLLAGAEGTLGIVTRLRFRLLARPAADSLVVAYCDTIVKAATAVQMAMPLKPSGIEIMDKSLLAMARTGNAALREQIPDGVDNVLLIEFDGPSADACAQPAAQIQRQLEAAGLVRQAHLAVSAEEKETFWAVRKAAVPILYKLKGRRKILALVEDAAVPVDRLVQYFNGIYGIFERLGVDFVLYGHIAKGLMHTRPLLDLKDPADVAKLRPIADAVYELVDSLGGTVSGEHGDGRLRSAYLRRKYPTIYDFFIETKRLLDPRGLFNPEIKAAGEADQMARHLRYGGTYRSRELPGKALNWAEGFALEAEKCHGCSKCTTVTVATRMCPVYKLTRDEAAAPKAKANLLRALLSGAVTEDALYSSDLQYVMDRCVNCGSCIKECPSNVNIPKLAMEARAQYVKRFGSTLPDILTANVETAARLLGPIAPLMAPMVKPLFLRRLAGVATGLAPQRAVVRFNRRSLFQRLPAESCAGAPTVLFYAGCHAGYIRPEIGEAAVGVLGAMGMSVLLPPQHCCGLPQLSKGMAAGARKKIDGNLAAWKHLLPRVDYIAVTCSSCGYALMSDWGYLATGVDIDEVSKKTIHISDLINRYRRRLAAACPDTAVAYHQPCHLKIQPAAASSTTLLSAIPGISVTDLKSHCCGMAGSWGLAAKNYDLSTAIGAPMISRLAASGARWAVTDCPTCEMQMAHLGALPVKHPVEVVWEGVKGRTADDRGQKRR